MSKHRGMAAMMMGTVICLAPAGAGAANAPRALVGCQGAIVRSGLDATAARQRALVKCTTGLLRCALTADGEDAADGRCAERAKAACGREIERLAKAAARRPRTLRRACARVTPEQLADTAAGLGFESLAPVCQFLGLGSATPADAASCVALLAGADAERGAARLLPRACELLGAAGLADAFPNAPCTPAPQ
jgi:hypothetical protein